MVVDSILVQKNEISLWKLMLKCSSSLFKVIRDQKFIIWHNIENRNWFVSTETTRQGKQYLAPPALVLIKVLH